MVYFQNFNKKLIQIFLDFPIFSGIIELKINNFEGTIPLNWGCALSYLLREKNKEREETKGMRFVASIAMLGYTRYSGVCAYNPESRGFDDLTPAEARRLIDQKQLKGVLWRNGEDGPEFYPDKDGFNQQDLMVKSANRFRPLLKDVLAGNPINSFAAVVRVLDTDYRGRLYEIISNKYSRLKVTEQNLRELSEITLVSGVWITENEIRVADDVMYEDRRSGASFTKGVYKNNVPVEITLESVARTAKAEAAIVQAEAEIAEGIRSIGGTEAERTESETNESLEEPAGEEKEPATTEKETAGEAEESATTEKETAGDEQEPTMADIFSGVADQIEKAAEKVETKGRKKTSRAKKQ